MKNHRVSLIVIIVLLVLVFVLLHPPKAVDAALGKETAYDRVIRTGVLRCGYIPFVPNLIKDPNSGAMSGIDYEVAEAIGKKLGLKIEWAEETGWATMVPGLKTGKFDVLCNGDWVNPMASREAYYARPYYYQPLFVVTRANDSRIDQTLDALNAANIKIASMDGDNPRFVAEEDFPKAQIYTLPDMAGTSAVLESVATGKADATFVDSASFGDYNEHNKDKLKLVQIDKPVRIYPVAFVLPAGEDKLRGMLNAAFDELIYSGQADKNLDRYETKYPYSYISIERPHVIAAKVGNSQ